MVTVDVEVALWKNYFFRTSNYYNFKLEFEACFGENTFATFLSKIMIGELYPQWTEF